MYCSCQEAYDDFFSVLACEELACTYFQAVDEFGCFSFTSGQEEACSCPTAKAASKSAVSPVHKFGPVQPSLRQTDLICDAPFDVDESQCASYNYNYDNNHVDDGTGSGDGAVYGDENDENKETEDASSSTADSTSETDSSISSSSTSSSTVDEMKKVYYFHKDASSSTILSIPFLFVAVLSAVCLL